MMNTVSSIAKCICAVEITPEMALAWLEVTDIQRPVKDRAVARFCALHRKGLMLNDGNPIKFSTSGKVIDGQHRLWTVVLTGLPFICDVRIGLPDEAATTSNGGTPGSLPDALAWAGLSNCTARAALLKQCILLASGSIVPLKTHYEYELWEPIFRKGIEWALSELLNDALLGTAAIAGTFGLAYMSRPAEINSLAHRAMSLEFSCSNDPAKVIVRLLSGDLAFNGSCRRFTIARKLLNIALADVEGRQLERVYDTAGGLEFFRKGLPMKKIKEMSDAYSKVNTDEIKNARLKALPKKNE